MYYICTDNPEQQKQLQLEFGCRNNFYHVPNKQSYFVTEMLSSISFEFFQNHIPPVVEKIKEMLADSMNATYSLCTFREIMGLLKKERDEIKLFKDYLIEMNTAFAQSPTEIDLQSEESDDLNSDIVFMETLKGESHLPQNLQPFQLPLFSELNIKCDSSQTKTEKTMQSDLCSSKKEEVSSLNLNESSTAKLSNFFNMSTFSRDDWKTERKQEEVENKQGSKDLSSFRKKGSTILDNNKDLGTILIKQIGYDLTREINLAKNTEQKTHIEIQKYSYQKKIKDALVNYKLKMRKRK